MSESNIEYKIEGIVTVGKRGQFVLPKELRSRTSINSSEKLALIKYQKTDGPTPILKKAQAHRLRIVKRLTDF
jgi:bifunctional DNA-binding transcriptional regulator/antitoxin component of YhaV-PrlF toxin-antitoxin module